MLDKINSTFTTQIYKQNLNIRNLPNNTMLYLSFNTFYANGSKFHKYTHLALKNYFKVHILNIIAVHKKVSKSFMSFDLSS